MWKPLFITAALVFAAPAWGNSAQQVRGLIASGDYDAARVTAEQLGTAEGYALAAESLSAQILLGEVTKLNKRSKEARKFAEEALELNPALYEAQFQYALADGFVTRTSGNLTAWRKKLPAKTYARVQAFNAAHPNNANGLALEGAWHMGVIRKAGEKNGGKWFGATLTEGQRLYGLSRALSPDDVVIETNYALSHLVLNPEGYAADMKPVLERVATLPAEDDLYKKVQAKAALILAAWEDKDKVEKLAGQFLDGEPLE